MYFERYFAGLKLLSSVSDTRKRVVNKKTRNAYGYSRSATEGSCVDREGNPVPWMTYPAVEYLSQFDFSKNSLFEWGSGNSSNWFSRRFASVVSVESDPKWYGKCKEALNPNQTLILREFNVRGSEDDDEVKSFANAILKQENDFDVIVNDAKIISRPRCTDNALKKLRPGGVVIFDNSDWFPGQCEKIRNAGFFQVDFHGNGPLNKYTWTTSIFFEPRADCILLTNPQTYSRVSKAGRATHRHAIGLRNP